MIAAVSRPQMSARAVNNNAPVFIAQNDDFMRATTRFGKSMQESNAAAS